MPRRITAPLASPDASDPMVSRWGGGPVVIRFTVHGAVPRKNRRTRTRVSVPKGAAPHIKNAFVLYYPSEEWRDWLARLGESIPANTRVERGAWAIRIWAYEGKLRHLDDDTLHLPLGDVDSPTSAILDGLQDKSIGILDDDARFLEEAASKHYDPDNPRVVIELSRVDPEPLPPKPKKRKTSP